MRKTVIKILLFLLAPITLVSAFWLMQVVKIRIRNVSDRIFMFLGVLPVLDQYYQPLINPREHLKKSLRSERSLVGIDFNTNEQLSILSKFNFNDELLRIPVKRTKSREYYYDNSSYMSGDSEYLYSMIRFFKPKRIIEIGSGFSTLMASKAISVNQSENSCYSCDHFCIEPYEQPWLEGLNVNLIRERVENISIDFFKQLDRDDILFIDSSHVIRPQGDVLFEYQEILPILKSGVFIHIHDIFSPRDYLDKWIFDDHLLWNEQYLLESFLSFNESFKIVGALNYLAHNYKDQFNRVAPIYAKQQGREPGAFWIQRV